jgi:hypothetical protein
MNSLAANTRSQTMERLSDMSCPQGIFLHYTEQLMVQKFKQGVS